MRHIFSRRDPSQKLSNPVPSHGSRTRLRRTPHTSVRSVRVGFLPIACKAAGLTLKNRTETEAAIIRAMTRCITPGLRLTARKAVTRSKELAIRKQDKDVIELVIQNSQNTMARTTA